MLEFGIRTPLRYQLNQSPSACDQRGCQRDQRSMTDRLSGALKDLLTDKDFADRRARLGDMAVPYATPAEFGRFLQEEDERYRALATGLKLE